MNYETGSFSKDQNTVWYTLVLSLASSEHCFQTKNIMYVVFYSYNTRSCHYSFSLLLMSVLSHACPLMDGWMSSDGQISIKNARMYMDGFGGWIDGHAYKDRQRVRCI